MNWQLAEAKNKMSEVYRRTLSEGRQIITKRGEKSVTVIATEELDRIEGRKLTLNQFLLTAPTVEEFELPSRDDELRDLEL